MTGFNPTLVRLRLGKRLGLNCRNPGFNPTLVRLRSAWDLVIVPKPPFGFNPTLVRLRLS